MNIEEKNGTFYMSLHKAFVDFTLSPIRYIFKIQIIIMMKTYAFKELKKLIYIASVFVYVIFVIYMCVCLFIHHICINSHLHSNWSEYYCYFGENIHGYCRTFRLNPLCYASLLIFPLLLLIFIQRKRCPCQRSINK